MTSDTHPQHVFLTGAASGIGRRIAARWLKRGGTLYAIDINERELHEVARADDWDMNRATLAPLDVRDTTALASAYAAADSRTPVDIMMNVAGVLRPQWCVDLDADAVDLQIDVNFKGVVHGTRIAASHMVPRGQGHIINIASMAAQAWES